MENMQLEAFLQGSFAIIVAGYLLLRMEKRMDDLTKAINLLRHCQTCRLSPWKTVINPDLDFLPPEDDE